VWGPVADVVVFIAATGQGVRLANAHLLSFAVATVLNYFLIVRSVAVAAGRSADWRLHVHLLVVSLFAVSLRGALLGLLTNVWGWPAQAAIVLAAVAAMSLALPVTPRGQDDDLDTRRRRAMAPPGDLSRRCGIPVAAALYHSDRAASRGFLLLELRATSGPRVSRSSPMVAWLIWLGTAVFGDSEFGVRIGALCARLLRLCSCIG